MRELYLIGIGTGSPDHVTREAQNALKHSAAVLVPRKGPDKSDLAELRMRILAEANATAHVIPFDYPLRDPDLPYLERVETWHDEIATRWSAALEDAPDGPVALLVWGDPALYDSTIRIAERLADLNIRVIPGITSIQALAAAHSLPLSTIGGGFSVTTGRVLRAAGWPDGVETLVVMLDGDCAFQDLAGGDRYDIWWGAFLGMEEQILIAGPLDQVATQIVAQRAEARAEHGWIMDTYILRRR